MNSIKFAKAHKYVTNIAKRKTQKRILDYGNTGYQTLVKVTLHSNLVLYLPVWNEQEKIKLVKSLATIYDGITIELITLN